MRCLVVAVALLAGCSRIGAGGCAYVGLALAASSKPGPSPVVPAKCCGKCNGTGRVKSGDGLAWVPCECPDTCSCKAASRASANCDGCKGFVPMPPGVTHR